MLPSMARDFAGRCLDHPLSAEAWQIRIAAMVRANTSSTWRRLLRFQLGG